MLGAVYRHLQDSCRSLDRILNRRPKQGPFQQEPCARSDEDARLVRATYICFWVAHFKLQLVKLLNAGSFLLAYPNDFPAILVVNEFDERWRVVSAELRKLVNQLIRDIHLVEWCLNLDCLIAEHVFNDMVLFYIVLGWNL